MWKTIQFYSVAIGGLLAILLATYSMVYAPVWLLLLGPIIFVWSMWIVWNYWKWVKSL